MQTYIELALEMKMLHARLISPEDMVFDIRTLLKCRWGCENHDNGSFKCRERGTSFEDRLRMIKAYKNILFIHSHDGGDVSRAGLEIERRAFLDGNHLAFAVRYCNLCKKCAVDENLPCVQPEKVRPCEALFGIDVYATAKRHGLPCYPLQHKDEIQNRYGFVCIS
nr:metal-binding protein [Desulfobacula sp.]